MFGVTACAIPDGALRAAHARDGGYADCYTTQIDGAVSQARYVEAFYTTPLFKLERLVLAAIARPSNDAQARQLAQGRIDAFAAWTVSTRDETQILLTDFRGQTRSWLMSQPAAGASHPTSATRLYFGSMVLPATGRDPGAAALGPGYRALLRFHRGYSVALLASARVRLQRNAG